MKTAITLLMGVHGIAAAATFTVTSTSDTGTGSLRQALLDANSNPGPDTITFAIGQPGSQQVIEPAEALLHKPCSACTTLTRALHSWQLPTPDD